MSTTTRQKTPPRSLHRRIVDRLIPFLPPPAPPLGFTIAPSTGDAVTESGTGLSVGFASFGEGRILRQPVTVANDNVLYFAESLSDRLLLEDRRDPAAAVGESVALLSSRDTDEKVVVVLSTGEPDGDSTLIRQSAAFAARRGVAVHVIYLGARLIRDSGLHALVTPGGLKLAARNLAELTNAIWHAAARPLRCVRAGGTASVLFAVDATAEALLPLTRSLNRAEAISSALGTFIRPQFS